MVSLSANQTYSCTYIREVHEQELPYCTVASHQRHKFLFIDHCVIIQGQAKHQPAMKSASLYVFIALGALIIGHTAAAPISDLGKELTKLLMSLNEQAEAETSDSIKSQEGAIIQMAFDSMQAFSDGVNEALAEEQQYDDGGYGGDISRAHINSIVSTIVKIVGKLLG